MAVTCGFFNSINHDRTYNADDFGSLFDGVITDGVFQTILNQLYVRAGDGMKIVVGSGSAWFNRTWTFNDSDLILNVAGSNIGYDRVDTVVLKVDKSETVRNNTIEVIRGIPGEGAPTLVDTDYIFYHPLANVNVKAGIAEISDSNIDNFIGTSVCPFVSGAAQHYNIDDLLAKWHSVFLDWFDHLQDELDSNQAANLQHQIDDLSLHVEDYKDEVDESIFKRYYDLCTRETTYTRDSNGDITSWQSTSDDGMTATTTITNNDSVRIIVCAVNDGSYVWTKTSTFNKSTNKLTESYKKEAVSG